MELLFSLLKAYIGCGIGSLIGTIIVATALHRSIADYLEEQSEIMGFVFVSPTQTAITILGTGPWLSVNQWREIITAAVEAIRNR